MANLFMRFPGGKAKVFTMSYDDGVEQDIRLIEIMNRYGLKGTFNINSGCFAPDGTVYPEGRVHRRMTQKKAVELYCNSGQEVAIHALTHPFLEQLPLNNVIYEIVEDRKRLEELFGYTVRGMAYPFGTYSDAVVDVLREVGIVYSRTTHSTENFKISDDWLRLNPTCHHNNPRLAELGDEFIESKADGAPQMFYLWGHSYEFEDRDNWDVIEKFAEKISGKQDIWYATNISVFDYITAYNQLRFSVDMKIVENPTAVDLCFNYKGKDYTVKSGERLITE